MEDCIGTYNEGKDLQLDECLINVTYTGNGKLQLASVYEACYKCQYQFCKYLENGLVVYNTRIPQKWRIKEIHNNKSRVVCDLEPNFGEFGVYDLLVSGQKCDIKTLKEPANIYLPLLILFCLIILGGLFLTIWNIFKQRLKKPDTITAEVSRRVTAIDVFRGITITLMIFVNDGAGGYEIIDHVSWNGLHVADVIFPWFLWVMGFCIPIAIESELKKTTKKKIYFHIFKRTLILFFLGVMMNTVATGADLSNIRIFGVLQRLAVGYFFGGFIYLICRRAKTGSSKISDISQLTPQWIVIFVICILHTSLMFLVKLPGCSRGYVGPGGWHDNAQNFNCTGGITSVIDDWLLGKSHIYQWAEIRKIYNSSEFDPENILGCLPSIVQVFFGIQAGVTLRTFKGTSDCLIRWCTWGFITGLASGILCNFQIEDGWIPINKNLWSLSFVLITTSLAFFALSLCFCIIDVKKLWSGKPFLYMGMNSTLMYIGHMVCYQMFPFHWSLGSMNTHLVILFENVWSTLIWIIIAYYLWKRKLFLKI